MALPRLSSQKQTQHSSMVVGTRSSEGCLTDVTASMARAGVLGSFVDLVFFFLKRVLYSDKNADTSPPF